MRIAASSPHQKVFQMTNEFGELLLVGFFFVAEHIQSSEHTFPLVGELRLYILLRITLSRNQPSALTEIDNHHLLALS